MEMKAALPFVSMVVSQVAQVGLTLAAQKAIATGMHNFSYVFYANTSACLFLLPAAFLLYRSSNLPAPTLSIAGSFLMVGILTFLVQIVGYAGITYISATAAMAILNLIPGFTFALAVIFRVERLDYGGLAKIIGTVVSVVGALIVTFYTGPMIITYLLSSITTQLHLGQSSDSILGGVLMLIDSILAALLYVAQAFILKKYPEILIFMLSQSTITAVLSLLASLILEHDLSTFSLRSTTRLLFILYAGFGVGFHMTVGEWCLNTKGPLFVVMFQPLGIVIAAIICVIFQGVALYLGCLIGSVVIVIGFYGVMWGKTKEDRIIKANMVKSSKFPLLQDNFEEHNVVLP